MTNEEPIVSIVMPVYNSGRFLREAIDSVRRQTFPHWELWAINDASTDDSADILVEEAARDSRIKLITLHENAGAAVARNAGTNAATGRYLAFLDADDLWLPNKLERQLEFMSQTDTVFSYTDYEFIDENGRSSGKRVRVPPRMTYIDALNNSSILTLTVMLDLEVIDKKWIQMPDVRRGQDMATWWQILKFIDHAHGLNEVLAGYRRTPGSLSSNKIRALQRTWYLYRRVEGFNLLRSSYHFVRFVSISVLKRL